MSFAKYLSEEGEHEILINGETNGFLYSIGGSGGGLGYHASRGSFMVDFNVAQVSTTVPAEDVVVTVGNNFTDVGPSDDGGEPPGDGGGPKNPGDAIIVGNGTSNDSGNDTEGNNEIISGGTVVDIISLSVSPIDYGATTDNQCVEFCYSETMLSMLAPQVDEGSCIEMGFDSLVEMSKIIQPPGEGELEAPLSVDIYQEIIAPIVPVASVCDEGDVIVHALNAAAVNYGASSGDDQCVQSCLASFLLTSPAKPSGFNEGSCEDMGFGSIVDGGDVVQPPGTIFPLTVDIFEKAQTQGGVTCEGGSVLVYALNADAAIYGADVNYNQCVESCLVESVWMLQPQGLQEGSCAQQGFEEVVEMDKVVEPDGFSFQLTVNIYEKEVFQSRQCSDGFVLVHVANTVSGNVGSVYQEDESDSPTVSPTISNGTSTISSPTETTPSQDSPNLGNGLVNNTTTNNGPDSTPTYPPTDSPVTPPIDGTTASPVTPTRNVTESIPTYPPTASPVSELGSSNETQPIKFSAAAMLDSLSSPYTMSYSLEFDVQRSRYGSSLAISDENGIVAVGARDGVNEVGVATGAVYLYQLAESDGTAELTLLQVLYGVSSKDQFGNAVALSTDGQRLVVGSRRVDNQRGAMRVYERRDEGSGGEEWVLMGGGLILGNAPSARGGWAVAISPLGDVVAMGSPRGGDEGGGSVQTLKYDSGLNEWEPYGSTIEGTREATGYSISLGGTEGSSVMIVGSTKARGSAGKVAMYTIGNSGDWEPLGQEVYGEAEKAADGWSVAMSGDGTIVVVGGKGRDKLDAVTGEVTIPVVGYCRVYKYQESSSEWELQHTIMGKVANERLGSSVAVSSDGNVVACGGVSGVHNYGNSSPVGIPGSPPDVADTATETISGVVRLYNMETQEESTLWPRGDAAAVDGSTFGSTVELSPDGGHVVVGAPTWTKSVDGDDRSFAGAIQIFHIID